jgi:predicted SprT family Zn-dependent metalloprotease
MDEKQKENKVELQKVSNEKPNYPCHICGVNRWIKRANGVGYVCGVCH